MNGGDLTPALVAAGGGSAMLAAIWAHERSIEAAGRADRVRLALRFPVGLEPMRAQAALDGLSGLAAGTELIAELRAAEGRVTHALWVPAAVCASAEAALRGAVPSIRLSQSESDAAAHRPATLSLRLFVPNPTLLATDSGEVASHTLLAGLAGVTSGEEVVIRWALRVGSPRTRTRRDPQTPAEREIDRALRRKAALPALQVAGLVLVRAGSVARARTLAGQVESVLRARRGATGQLRPTSERGNRRMSSLPRATRSSGLLSSSELLALLGWPVGDEASPGVELGAARELPVPRHVPRSGRRLFIGRDASGERPVALTSEAASMHLALLGATGAGKSSVLGRQVLDTLAAGHGGVLIDPKDLALDLIDRVPPRDAHRVVLLDPAGPGQPLGLDLFGAGDAHLRSDVILSVIKTTSDGWGPRIEQYLRMGLQTLGALPQPVLSDWLRLYSDPQLRRQAMTRLDDPFLVAEWQRFESLGAAEQFQHSAPSTSRIAGLLARPRLRGILDQREPRLNVARLIAEGKWLFVALSPGTLGEPAARLLGAILVYLLWTVVEGRAAVAPQRRAPIVLAIDELQSLAALPFSLELFFERARSMNCGVVAATQTTARLPESLRASLLGNVGSLVTFRMGADEARIARELPGLTAADIMSLARFEVAARVNTAGAGPGSAVVTGRTEPLPSATGQGATIRARSIQDYGGVPSTPAAERPGDAEADGTIGLGRRRP